MDNFILHFFFFFFSIGEKKKKQKSVYPFLIFPRSSRQVFFSRHFIFAISMTRRACVGRRYAAQMRQSAVYLHQTPQHHQQQRNQSLSRTTMPSKATGIRDRSDESRIATLPEVSCSALRRGQHVHQQHVIPHQSLQRHTE